MNSRLSLILILLLSCSHRDDFDLQGHRGAVGLFPENSIIGFYPDIYSPNFKNLTYEIVKKVQEKKIQVIPWTVNSNDDIAKILELGVDGIISDYPNRVKYLLNEKI